MPPHQKVLVIWSNFTRSKYSSKIFLNLNTQNEIFDRSISVNVFALGTLDSCILFLCWQYNWYPDSQLATYVLSCFCISLSSAVAE